jgi:restriction endonuclease S subunit
MAIAEDIGYDATGKSTNNNELDFIGRELARFIESIESGKDGFFLGLDVDKDKIFLVNLVEIDERLDPTYYLPSLRGINYIYETKKLNNISKCIIHPPEHKRIYVDRGIQLLRSQNIRPDGIDISNSPVFLDSSILSSTEIFPRIGDVLVVRSGVNAGDTATIDVELPNIVIGADTLLIRLENSVEPKYIQCFFSLVIGQKIMQRSLTGATNKHISPYNLSKINIPVPNLNIQKIIISQMDDAYAAKKQKELEAQQLLDSIDDYLLGELGIELPEPEENTIQNRIFIRNLSEVSGDRFDPSFYKPEHIFLFSTIKKLSHDKLGHIVKFSYEAWDQKSIFVEKFPYIEIGEINVSLGEIQNISMIEIEDAPSRARMIVRGGDILISTTRPNRGAIVKIDQGDNLFIASTGFAIIRQIINKNLNKDFLFYALRQSISLKQMEQRSSGGNYPAITQEELKNILIPLPPLEKQIEISEHITAIRNQAKQLQQQAKDDLEKAKQEVEAMILGDD